MQGDLAYVGLHKEFHARLCVAQLAPLPRIDRLTAWERIVQQKHNACLFLQI